MNQMVQDIEEHLKEPIEYDELMKIAYDYQYSSTSAFSNFHGLPPSLVNENKMKAYPMIPFHLEVK